MISVSASPGLSLSVDAKFPHSVGQPAGLQVIDAQVVVGLRQSRIQTQGFLVMRDAFLPPALLCQRHPPVALGGGRFGVGFEGGLIMGHGLVVFLLLGQQQSHHDVRRVEIRPEPQRLVIFGQRLGGLPLPFQRAAEEKMRFGISRFAGQRLAVETDGVVQFPLVRVHAPDQRHGQVIVFGHRHRPAKKRAGVLPITKFRRSHRDQRHGNRAESIV